MKKLCASILIFLGLLVMCPSVAPAQTSAEVLAAMNGARCEDVGLTAGCTDAQHLVSWCVAGGVSPCVDTRTAEQRIYSTPAAYATAVLIPQRQREVFGARRSQVIQRLLRVIADPPACVAVMTAAQLDTAVCK